MKESTCREENYISAETKQESKYRHKIWGTIRYTPLSAQCEDIRSLHISMVGGK